MKGHIRQRGKDSWAIVVYLGRGVDGRPLQKWTTVRGTRKDAERELTATLHSINTGSYFEPSKLSVGDYLGYWLEHYAKPSVAGKTYERYEEIVRLHLAPNLGHVPLAKLRPLHIQSYYALAAKPKGDRPGLGAQSILHSHRLLHSALRQAIKWQLIPSNPAEAVEPPRPKRGEMVALTPGRTSALLSLVSGTRLAIPFLVAVTTGLRRGELLGLRWSDIDLSKAEMTVSQSIEQTAAGVLFKEPKTTRGRRKVVLPQIAVAGLLRHRSRQAEERLALGADYKDLGLVFPGPIGKPWPPDSFTSTARYWLDKLGGDHIRFHDLRHTHATHLLQQGINPKVVSERLGHSTIAITLDVYSHVMPGMQEAAAAKIDDLLTPVLVGT